jgi:hypothetical protein
MAVGYFSLSGKDATDFPSEVYLMVFNAAKADINSYIGIELSDKLIFQMKPSGKRWYVEILDTEILKIKWSLLTKTEAKKILKTILKTPKYTSEVKNMSKDWEERILISDDDGHVDP